MNETLISTSAVWGSCLHCGTLETQYSHRKYFLLYMGHYGERPELNIRVSLFRLLGDAELPNWPQRCSGHIDSTWLFYFSFLNLCLAFSPTLRLSKSGKINTGKMSLYHCHVPTFSLPIIPLSWGISLWVFVFH